MITPGKIGDLPVRVRGAGRSHVVPRGVDRRFVTIAAFAIALMAVTWLKTGNFVLPLLALLLVFLLLIRAHGPLARTNPATVVILGHSSLANVLSALLTEAPASPRARLRHRRRMSYRRIASIGEAEELLRTTRCDHVIAADPSVDAFAPQLTDSDGHPVEVVDGVNLLERALGRLPLEFLSDGDRIAHHANRYRESTYRFVKRLMDVVLALVVGVIVLPLLPLIALAIKLDSGGPILYHQGRVGLNNRIFNIHKFRTMHADAEREGAVWAQVDDPRVTRLGRLLRRTRIDELPQIWNVLCGEMSFVGPRPERPQFTELLEREIPGYQLRNLVRPGVTGWAQVRFRYTSSLHDSRVKLEYDLYYVKNASLLLDVKILFLTIFVVLGMRGV
jgi:exopolysaccharide biosynthesis polyprenyl glycosylphosphotransferase